MSPAQLKRTHIPFKLTACFSCHRPFLSHRYYGASHSMNHCYSCRLWSLCPIISILWSARTKHQNIIVITYINSLIVWKHCYVSHISRTHFSISSSKQISASHRFITTAYSQFGLLWKHFPVSTWTHFPVSSLKHVSVSLMLQLAHHCIAQFSNVSHYLQRVNTW